MMIFKNKAGQDCHGYFVNDKTKKRYAVVNLDNEAGTITLKGEHEPFTEPYDKEWLVKQGYHLERVPVEA